MCPCTPRTISVPGQRAAAAVLDHVAEAVDRRWLADDAVVERLARGAQPIDDAHRAVDGGTFLVGGDQQRDRPLVLRVRGRRTARSRRRTPRARISCRRRRGRTDSRRARVGANGSECQASSGPVGTTSVCPAKQTTGRASPRRAQRLVTPLDAIVSQRKPSGARRARGSPGSLRRRASASGARSARARAQASARRTGRQAIALRRGRATGGSGIRDRFPA